MLFCALVVGRMDLKPVVTAYGLPTTVAFCSDKKYINNLGVKLNVLIKLLLARTQLCERF